MDRDAELLRQAEQFFVECVKPHAQALDGNPAALEVAIAEMGRRELFALRRPDQFGGPGMSERAFRQFQEMSARYSGTLSFLMTQHQSAVSLLSKSDNAELQQRTLPRMNDGALRIGIGISQLRRGGQPLTTAVPVEGGYTINGHIPWITGYGFYDAYVIGARLPDNTALFGVLPFHRTGSDAWPVSQIGSTTYSEPMRLAAMEAAQTVTANLTDVFLPESDVLMIKPADWPETNDMINIVLQGHFALGCAQAGVDIVREAHDRKPLDFILESADRLQAEVDHCREAAHLIAGGMDDRTTDEKLQVRAWAIALAIKCAHAAIVASGGAANSIAHPAQRVYREALVFSVSAQTTDIMRATLSRLTKHV